MAGREQIAQWLGLAPAAEPVVDAVTILAVASIGDAGPSDLVFAATQSAYEAALASAAGLVLAKADLVATDGGAVRRTLFVADPRLGFSLVAARLAPQHTPGVHPTAIVDATASVHATATVGPGTVIGAAVCIGEGCVLAARVVVEAGVVLGSRVRVQSGAVLGSLGFGYARMPGGSYVLFPQQGTLVLEDDVEVGANSTIDRGALGETRIGAGTKIDNLVHIGHNCRIGRNVILAAQTGISGSTVVEDGAVLGGQVGIGEHAIVGPGVILGGGAGVLSNKRLYGPGKVFWGRPAQPLKQYLRDLARLRKGGA